jgi:hypothetical protein
MTGIASFQIETTLNGQPATIHVQDRRADLFEVQLSFEYVLNDSQDGCPTYYANSIGMSTVSRTDPLGLPYARRDAAIIAAARAYVASSQEELAGSLQRELDEINEFVEQIDEKLARRDELVKIIATDIKGVV